MEGDFEDSNYRKDKVLGELWCRKYSQQNTFKVAGEFSTQAHPGHISCLNLGILNQKRPDFSHLIGYDQSLISLNTNLFHRSSLRMHQVIEAYFRSAYTNYRLQLSKHKYIFDDTAHAKHDQNPFAVDYINEALVNYDTDNLLLTKCVILTNFPLDEGTQTNYSDAYKLDERVPLTAINSFRTRPNYYRDYLKADREHPGCSSLISSAYRLNTVHNFPDHTLNSKHLTPFISEIKQLFHAENNAFRQLIITHLPTYYMTYMVYKALAKQQNYDEMKSRVGSNMDNLYGYYIQEFQCIQQRLGNMSDSLIWMT